LLDTQFLVFFTDVTYETQDMLDSVEISSWLLPINENDETNYSSTVRCEVQNAILLSRMEIVIYKHFTKNWSGDNEWVHDGRIYLVLFWFTKKLLNGSEFKSFIA